MTRQNYKNLIAFLSLFLSIGWAGAQASFYFDQISLEDGLTDNRIESILQDSKGFVWFATENGLNRHDGRQIRAYEPVPNKIPKVAREIFEDREGKLWIGGGSGIFSYAPKQEAFETLYLPQNSAESMAIRIWSIYQDRRENIWIGTIYKGLMRFDPSAKQFVSFAEEFKKDLEPKYVMQILEDSQDNLWFSYPNGLYQFSWADSSLIYHPFRKNDLRTVDDRVINTLYEDSRQNLWVGTRFGLSQFDRKNKKFIPYPIDLPTSAQPTLIVVDAICEAPNGALWIGTLKGLLVLDTEKEQIAHYPADLQKEGALKSNSIREIYRDRYGGMWVGTLNAGVFYWSPHRKAFKSWKPRTDGSENGKKKIIEVFFESQNGNLWATSDQSIQLFDPLQHASFSMISANIAQDREGRLWAGSWQQGLRRYDDAGRLSAQYRAKPDRMGSLGGNASTQVLADRQGKIWVGVWLNGLYRYDPERDAFDLFPLLHPQIPKNGKPSITTLFEDSAGNLWIGTAGYNSLIQLNPDRNIESVYEVPAAIMQIHEDKNKRFWLASRHGLYQLESGAGLSQIWTTKDGLPNNSVFSILEDEQGRLWLGTQKGLSCFDPKTKTFKNYDISDGLPGLKFGYYTGGINAVKMPSGELYFGTHKGILHFHPDDVRDNPSIPPVALMSFKIGNRETPIKGSAGDTLAYPSPLLQSIIHAQKICLRWFQNDLSFEFVALNYLQPEKNQYQYRLKNYDETWIGTDAGRPFANYTNLDPGSYTFQVKGANNDGVWNEEITSLDLIIAPPWWLSVPAKVLYGIAFFALLYLIHYLELRKQKRKLAFQQEKLAYQEKVNAATSKFVPNDFIQALGRSNIMDVQLGDAVAREVTVMFSDIRNYTTLAEKMTPEENFRFVNALNKRMGPIIQKNQGFVNQYLGDAIMALFNSSAAEGLSAAIQMQQELSRYNRRRVEKQRPPIQIGIGLHSGPLIMGIIGDEKRMDAATISDTVNTASRIESLTKYFRVRILLSEESLEQIHNQPVDKSRPAEGYYLRYLGRVQLKGKKNPTGVYECFNGDQPFIIEQKLKSQALFEEGTSLYFSRQFTAAIACFEELLGGNPGDKTARLFRDKANRYIIDGVSEDWTGVEIMTFK